MKEISEKHEARTYGERIRFQIEFMHTMLASGREVEALEAINKALTWLTKYMSWRANDK